MENDEDTGWGFELPRVDRGAELVSYLNVYRAVGWSEVRPTNQ